MDTDVVRQPSFKRERTSSLLLGEQFLKTQCLHQQGALQIWSGTDLSTGAPVVVKTAPLVALQVGAFERMLRDDAVLRDLRSPRLSPPLGSGLEGDLLFRVRPGAPLATLEARLAMGPLSVQEALQLGRGILRALGEAHAQGVLHRHLAPSRVAVDPEKGLEAVTLIDFGLALEDLREQSLVALPLTAIQYLSPEQLGLVAGEIGPGSDLYAVGVMLFEGLAGALPFHGASLGELLRQHLRTVPELRALGLAVPRALEQVVQHLLCEEPRERYQVAAAALSDLESIALEMERGTAEPFVVVGRSDRHQRLSEPVFIGRAAELRVLERSLSEAAQGNGGLVLVEGESGGGKTMLLDELERRALARGVRVFRGQAIDGGAPQPLQTLIGVLRELGPAAKNLPGLAHALSTLAGTKLGAALSACPQLKELVTVPVPARPGGESLREGCVTQRLATVLESLGEAKSSALVLLDDCQWSDGLTLKTLAMLGKASGEQPGPARFITVVAAFRKEEVPEAHPLRRMVPMHHVCLEPFKASDLRDLAESMAGLLPEEALELVVQRSEGNPFMAVALVRGLVECGALEPMASGWRVEPKRLAEVNSSRRAATLLLHRLELFSEGTRALLAAGAVLGREFDVGLAAVLARQRPEQAVVALEEARRRHLLWADGAKSRYTFAHDRIREALLEHLPVEESRALHLAAAQELERHAPERSFDLAWHFEAAGELRRAWPHALKSAETARRDHALDLAERYYRLADAGAVDAEGATRMAILEGLGDVLLIRSAHEEAARSYTQAQAFATSRLDRARLEGRRGEVALRRGELSAAVGPMERALGLLGRKVPVSPLARVLFLLWEFLLRMPRALWLKRPSRRSPVLEGEPLLAARLYLWLLHIYWFRGGSPVAAGWALLRGLNIAERYAPTPELATALANQGGLPLIVQSIPRVPRFLADWALAQSQRCFQRALALREAFGDILEHGTTLAMYQFTLLHCARYEEGVEAGRKALHLLQQAGARDEWHAATVQYSLGIALYLKGELTSAVELGQAMYRQHRERGDVFKCIRGLELWSMASGGQVPAEAIAAAHALLSSDGRSTSSLRQLRQATLFLAEGLRLLRAGQPAQAAALLEQALQDEKSLRLRLPLFRGWAQAQLVMALRQQAAQVPAHFFSRRAELLLQAKAVARKVLRRAALAQGALAPTLRQLGLIAAMEGKNARAHRYLDRSLATAERLEMRYERAQTLLARAELGAALGWLTAAQDAAAGEEALRPMRAALEPTVAPEPQASLSLVDRFPRILEAGRSIAAALSRENVLASVREAASGLLRGEECVLLEATPAGLRGVGGAEETVWPFVHRAQELKLPVVPSLEELEGAGDGRARSALCAPILVRGQVEAVFCVTNHKLAGAFGPQEVRIAEFIATLAGAALENAQGFAEVNALSEERGRLYAEAQAALRKRDEFLAVASHELRTPFTPMRIYLQGMINALRNPAKSASLESWVKKLETANHRLQRLARLVEDLFDVSRLAQGQVAMRLGEVDLAALTAEAVDRWKDELGRLKCDYTLQAPTPVIGHWDALRLEQVIDNLLGNAAKYGPGKPISLSVTREGAVARLTVKDGGMGIAPEDQARIFERFERAVSENYGGFGLGLWISREVVRAHHGRIFLESAPGQGATFTVELPLKPEAEQTRRLESGAGSG